MIRLTDDTLNYLINIIIDKNTHQDVSSFITCHKIKSIIYQIFNNKCKIHYKPLIKNNVFKYPLKSYYHINKIYGDKIIISREKLLELLLYSIKNDNVELIKILYNSVSNTIKSTNFQNELLRSIDSSNIINIALSELKEYNYDIMTVPLFSRLLELELELEKEKESVLIINYHKQLNFLLHNDEYRNQLIHLSLMNDNIILIKLIINNVDINDLLIRSILCPSIEIIKYILHNCKYDNIYIKNYLSMRNCKLDTDVLALLISNKCY